MTNTNWITELEQLIAPEAVFIHGDEITAHSYDWWPVATKWKMMGQQPYKPDAVIRVIDTAQISKILTWASAHDIPVTPWGAGSGVTGAAIPTRGGIVLDTSAMDKILVLDEENMLVKVQAGKMGHHLEEELNKRGYTLNHSPQSLDRSTVGGWIATRAIGQFSSKWGGIEDLAICFTVVLPTGEVVETKSAPRAAIGPDLRHVFMGAEGTMGVITDVTMKIFAQGDYQLFEALEFDSVRAGVTAMRRFMQCGLRPFLVRFYDEDEARHAMQDKTFAKCVMFLGFDDMPDVANAQYNACMAICSQEGGRAIGPDAVLAWMKRRYDFSTIENILAQTGGLAETIEVAHFWDGILETYELLRERLKPYAQEVLGHFSHVYHQGTSLYIILLGETESDEAAAEQILKIWEIAMTTCLETGAVISHHHGIGLARAPYIRSDLATSAIILDRVKSAIDPSGIMNPGKLGLNCE